MSKRILWSKDGTQFTATHENHNVYAMTQDYANRWDSDDSSNGTANLSNIGSIGADGQCVVFNFASPVQIDKFAFRAHSSDSNAADGITAQYSTNTTTGGDGDWISISSSMVIGKWGYTKEMAVTPTSTQWFRLLFHTGGSQPFRDMNVSVIHLWGTYDTPQFEMWDDLEVGILDTEIALSFPVAESYADYDETISFKIKNVDASAHTYNITVLALPYSGDTFVTTYFKVSETGGDTDVTTLTTASVASGAFSAQIDVGVVLSSINNPKDGNHYLRLLIEEAT